MELHPSTEYKIAMVGGPHIFKGQLLKNIWKFQFLARLRHGQHIHIVPLIYQLYSSQFDNPRVDFDL